MNETEAKRYHLAKKLFLEALEQPAEQRSAYLNKACPDDAKLRREVAALLADHDRLPDTPVLPKLAMPSGDSPGPLPERVGPFKILEELGHGGMGVVYLAERDRPHQRVALKVIKLGMDTKAVLARFEAEQEALALMDHPGVAKMYQAGATQEGQPYFAMEYVAGLPITEYCDEHRLNTTQRLKLFVEVCQAVQHAHQKGIIHRDIKPSNVLVTEKDDQPVAKVIDFGVARSTAQRLTEQTLFTQQGQFVGTPEYMSPEQAGHNIRDIDTRTDVYSLGVLLYELLVGALPFDRKTLREAALGEIQRMIREEDPPKPSTRLSSLGDKSVAIAKKRDTNQRSLARNLRDDLDAITMMAMHKNRKHRYATATAFAEDIRRHLCDEPIVAPRPSGVAYRLRKFLRRHERAVLSFGALLTVLTIGLIVSNRQRRRAIRAEAVAKKATLSVRRRAYIGNLRLSQAARASGDIDEAATLLYSTPKDLRGIEWRWLQCQLSATKDTQTHIGVRADDFAIVVANPESHRIAGEYAGGATMLVESKDNDTSGIVLDHTRFVANLCFDDSGTHLAWLHDDGSITVLAISTHASRRISAPIANSRVSALCPGPTGSIVIGTRDGQVALLDPSLLTVALLGVISDSHHFGRRHEIVSLAVTHGLFVAAYRDGVVAAFTVDERTISILASIYHGPVRSLAVAGNAAGFAIGSDDNTITYYSLNNLTHPNHLRGHTKSVRAMTFTPNGSRLISVGDDGTFRIWDPVNGNELIEATDTADQLVGVSMLPDGAFLTVSSSGELTVHRIACDSLAIMQPHILLNSARRLATFAQPLEVEPLFRDALHASSLALGTQSLTTVECAIDLARVSFLTERPTKCQVAHRLLFDSWETLRGRYALQADALRSRILDILRDGAQAGCGLSESQDAALERLKRHPASMSREAVSLSECLENTEGALNAMCPETLATLDQKNRVILSIDRRVQIIVDGILAAAVSRLVPTSAVAIVLDPRTGYVLGTAGIPSIDTLQTDDGSVISWNDALFQLVEPGSLLLPFVAASAVAEGKCSWDEVIDIQGPLRRFNGRVIADEVGHEQLTVENIVIEPSFIGLAILSERLGKVALYSRLRSFGFGRTTGIDLPQDRAGMLRPTSEWSPLSTISIGLGYELVVTPLQILDAFSAMVNGGISMEPRLTIARATQDEDSAMWPLGPRKIGRVLETDVASHLREKILPVVVRRESTRREDTLGLIYSGFSGTAKLYTADQGYEAHGYLATAVGAAPVDHPSVAVLVVINRPQLGSHHGWSVAAPVVEEILTKVLDLLRS